MSVSGCLVLIIASGAAVMDLQNQRIANGWLLSGAVLGVWYQLFDPGGRGLAEYAKGLILPLLLLGVLFYFRMLGAGDIKLLSVLGGIMGWEAILTCVFWSLLFGAALSVLILSACGNWLQRLSYFTNYVRQYLNTKHREPYRRTGRRQEHIHFSIPVLMGALLWIGGIY